MKTNSQLVADFTRNASRFFERSKTQRDEIFLSYQYRDSNQFKAYNSFADKQDEHQKTAIVNVCAPIVRAVAGSEVMSAATIDYIATDPGFDAEADIISDVVEWCQYASDYYAQRAMAAEDAATCGIGAIVTYLDMTKEDFIAGVPVVRRIAPQFMFYDLSPRGSNLNPDSRWCGYAEPLSGDAMTDYIERNSDEKKDVDGAGDFKEYILANANSEDYDLTELLYHYFWREYVDLYDVANPFIEEGSPLTLAVQYDDTVANLIGRFATENTLNWQAAYWTLDKEAFKQLKEVVETIQLLMQDARIPDIEYSKRNGLCYYRAQFARGKLLKRSRSYTQNGHAMNFITGYFDESTGNYYGMMRPLSYIQDYLNITMADLLTYTRSMVLGGDAYISTPPGKEEAIARIAKAKKRSGNDIPVPEGTNVVPRALPATAQQLSSVVNMLIEIMPRVLGLGQEFFGVITKGDITDSMFGQVVRQSFNVLENWKNSSANADVHQGYIFEDLVRLMAEANDGMILPILSSDGEQQSFMRLSQQSLARNYSIRIVERPLTKDERQETFNKLSAIAPQAMQAGVNIFPMLAKYAALDRSDRQEMIRLATPQPPQPDPLNQATLEANINYTNASAAKAQADAQKTQAEIQAMLRRNQLDDIEQMADIEKKQASADFDKARTVSEVIDVQMNELDRTMAIMNRMDARLNQMFNQ